MFIRLTTIQGEMVTIMVNHIVCFAQAEGCTEVELSSDVEPRKFRESQDEIERLIMNTDEYGGT